MTELKKVDRKTLMKIERDCKFPLGYVKFTFSNKYTHGYIYLGHYTSLFKENNIERVEILMDNFQNPKIMVLRKGDTQDFNVIYQRTKYAIIPCSVIFKSLDITHEKLNRFYYTEWNQETKELTIDLTKGMTKEEWDKKRNIKIF